MQHAVFFRNTFFSPVTWIILFFAISSANVATAQPADPRAKSRTAARSDLWQLFEHPPESAKPGVLWMWMGSNVSKHGIARDLEALKREGFNRTTMFSLADLTTPWAEKIGRSPTPQLIAWTEPWWDLVRFAARQSNRLHMDFGMFNGAGYEASGGTWISPENSMQELVWSVQTVFSKGDLQITLERPRVSLRGHTPYPVYDPQTGQVDIPEIPSRGTYYKDIAVLALPSKDSLSPQDVIDLTAQMRPDGGLSWNAPTGGWTIYRFGHTTSGTLIQPAQWEAAGLECDKMSQQAVDFHMDHVIGEIQKHLHGLIGKGFTHVHFDSYEAGDPTWTPLMRESFRSRRGYDLLPFLPIFAGRMIGSREDSSRFRNDFDATVKDLYHDVYFSTISRRLRAAGLIFLCEPYGGPWRLDEVMPLVPRVMTEFWTNGGVFSPYLLQETVAALRKSGQNIIEAEAFTGDPSDSKWTETPEWLKPIGDEAFCAGVNRLIVHRFVQQPWDDTYKPGATMGRWGTHFDRTQTWWKPARAMIRYWQRCQALLQWGHIAPQSDSGVSAVTADSILIKSIHRKLEGTDLFFIANTSRLAGKVRCSFPVMGRQPEIWDPVRVTRIYPQSASQSGGQTTLEMSFDKAQSFFVVFRRPIPKKGIVLSRPRLPHRVFTLGGPWQVSFDAAWGGPAQPVRFDSLSDWTTNALSGIRYYSGTAVYQKNFDMTQGWKAPSGPGPLLDLGRVKHIAHVWLNSRDLGVVWTAPWNIVLPAGLLKPTGNRLVVEVTNVWANRLIGDEQEPADMTWNQAQLDDGRYLKEFPDWFLRRQKRPSAGRYCFTTWNYFNSQSVPVSSGLLGPVSISQ